MISALPTPRTLRTLPTFSKACIIFIISLRLPSITLVISMSSILQTTVNSSIILAFITPVFILVLFFIVLLRHFS